MKITKIEQQKNNKQRYSIYINDEFALGVDEQTLIHFALFKEMAIDQALLNEIQAFDQIEKVYQKALNYLSFTVRSKKDMRDYLEKLRLPSNDPKEKETPLAVETIDQVIQRLIDLSYLDDRLYGQMYTRNAFTINLKGPNNIRQELYRKGLSEEDILVSLQEYTPEQEEENIIALSEKYIRSHKQLPFKMLQNKLRQYLMTKGYSKDAIEHGLSLVDIEEDEDEEMALVNKEAEKQVKRLSRRYSGYDLKQRLQQTLYRKGYDYQLINQWMEDQQELFNKD